MGQKMELTMEQLKEMIGGLIVSKANELGLTRVERQAIHPALPDMDDVMGRRRLTPEKAASIACFFRGLFLPEARFQEVGGVGGPFWKDMSVATDTAGGFLVPTEFRDQVIISLEKMPVMRNIVTVFPVSAKDEIPRMAAKPAASWGSENVDFGEVDATLDNVLLATNLLKILTKTSRKLVANSRVDIVQLLTQLFAVAFGKAEDAAFVSGTGTTKPWGVRIPVVVGEQITSVAQAGASLAGDDLIELYHALPSQYRQNATWLMPDSVIKKVRKLKETTTGNYLWTPGLAGAPATILGRPVMEQNDIPTNLGAGSPAVESEIWFGDFKFYYVGDGETMSVESTTTGGTAFGSHQLHIKAYEELDGRVALPEAFRYMTGVK